MRKKRKSKQGKKAKKKRLSLLAIFKAKLPAAIMARISPLMTLGTGVLLASLILLAIPSLRLTTPLFLVFGLMVTGYAVWLKADVLKRGYDEYIFKVIDYTYISPIITAHTPPTGMLLLNKTEENINDANTYHVTISGKKNPPPIDWLIRVYVPKGMQAAEFGDRKYFPVVYGYRLEGEDK